MSEKQLLQDPSNRVVSVFDSTEQAEAARQQLIEEGFSEEQVRVLQGKAAADRIDTSAKWFADTDEELERYRGELAAGSTVVSVPTADQECRENIHAILKQHDARLVTHFGEWITEMLK